MATDVQIVIDCGDPHGLDDWWAEALGWQVEPQDEASVRRMVESGAASTEATTTHRGALVWRSGAAVNSPDPGRPRVLLQLVPEANQRGAAVGGAPHPHRRRHTRRPPGR